MPTMPSALPRSRRPSIQVGDQPGHVPVARQHLGALDQPARQRQHQQHRHVGGVFGQDRRRVGHGQARRIGGLDVDIVETVAELRDEFDALGQAGNQVRIDPVGDRRDQHVAAGERRQSACRRGRGRRSLLKRASNNVAMRASTGSGSRRVHQDFGPNERQIARLSRTIKVYRLTIGKKRDPSKPILP